MPTTEKSRNRDINLTSSEKLIAGAKTCLLEDGAAHTSLKTIAARAGVNHGLIHRYFGSKEDLMIAVHDDIEFDLPVLGLKDRSEDADRIMAVIFKDQRISIELLSLSYQMPKLKQAMLRRSRKVIRRYSEQVPNMSQIDLISLGAEILGLAVYHALDPKMPIKKAVECMLDRYADYSD